MILDPNPSLDDFPASWAVAFGEDAFGLWQAFEIDGVRQVMRWIVPGRFMMGSPEQEAERLSVEILHQVTLSRGFWMADTACSQALWQVVMGTNPAHFCDTPECPVESISWDNSREFITRLNARLGNRPQLRLPTEAEWEYACRAGSNRPFSWGDSLATSQANYKGDFPYAAGEEGEYRERTVPVLSFEPNAWGLYQMHGNVWEWCDDWLSAYPTAPVVDPNRAEGRNGRVLRGGCWNFGGLFLRSAFRTGFSPRYCNVNIGLRLAGG